MLLERFQWFQCLWTFRWIIDELGLFKKNLEKKFLNWKIKNFFYTPILAFGRPYNAWAEPWCSKYTFSWKPYPSATQCRRPFQKRTGNVFLMMFLVGQSRVKMCSFYSYLKFAHSYYEWTEPCCANRIFPWKPYLSAIKRRRSF